FMPKKSAKIVILTTRSAVSNLLNTDEGAKVNPDELVIQEAYVNQGPMMKRIRPVQWDVHILSVNALAI
ncbi:MAG: uL22 family ribosomal protein, partial [Candidatus Marinimicrobia bacterium]|nr:uL22 family ribosomal protein [Candidatus Neomarinimicrobiota bacterium]